MSTQVPPSRLDSTKDFSSLVPSAFARANAAFAQANNSTDTWVRGQANNAFDTANAAFLQANNSTDSWVRTQANNSFNKANSAADFANASFLVANSAFTWGNHASAGYATTTYVGTAVANLVNSAPSTLDTLNELATALGNDANFSTTITNMVGTANSFANGAFTQANSAASFANGAFGVANTSASFANGAFIQANAVFNQSNTYVWPTANSAASFANGAFDRANSAYAQANTGGGSSSDTWARVQANAAFETANSASNTANSFTGNIAVNIDNFTGDGSTTNFTMSTAPTDANNVIINVNGVIQLKQAYTVTANSTTLTLSSAPANGAKVDAIIFKSGAVSATSGGGTTRAQSMTMSIIFGG